MDCSDNLLHFTIGWCAATLIWGGILIWASLAGKLTLKLGSR